MASLSSESKRRIMRQIRQREAATGRAVSSGFREALIRQELEVAATRSTQNRALEIQQEGLEERQRQFDESLQFKKDTASTAGKIDLASLGVTGALLLKDTKAGKAIGDKVSDVTEGVKNVFSPDEPGTAAAETGTEAVKSLSQTDLGSSAADAGFGAATALSQTDLGSSAAGTGMRASEAIKGAGSATQASATTSGAGTTPSAAPVGATSYVQAGAGAAGAASIGRWLGGQSGDSTSEDIGTIGAGALYGTAALGPGFGTVVGAAVGVVVDVVSDATGTIICSELHRQGYMSDEILELDSKYRQEYVDNEVYEGYLILARPVVELMQKSKAFTWLIAPFALAWAYEMASRVDSKIKGNVVGKFINYIGQPLCRLASQRRLCHG